VSDDDLFSYAKRIRFNDMTQKDASELRAGVREVMDLMRDGQWHDREEIIQAAKGSEGLRRMRELRKRGFSVEKQRKPETRSWSYRLIKK